LVTQPARVVARELCSTQTRRLKNKQEVADDFVTTVGVTLWFIVSVTSAVSYFDMLGSPDECPTKLKDREEDRVNFLFPHNYFSEIIAALTPAALRNVLDPYPGFRKYVTSSDTGV
jgi:hypothetical protein